MTGRWLALPVDAGLLCGSSPTGNSFASAAMRSKSHRLQVFISRLKAAPPVSTKTEALALIATVLDEVEDELSGIVANPANWRSDGRMYPPQDDNARASVTPPGITVYRSRHHRTLLWESGGFAIVQVGTGDVVVVKPGTDGVHVDPTGVE